HRLQPVYGQNTAQSKPYNRKIPFFVTKPQSNIILLCGFVHLWQPFFTTIRLQ
ncbi:MAG: hypothetical protein ACI8P3_003623, partial [Saprospiraceae bacterium]